MLLPAGAPKSGGGGWIRTNVGARPTDLQSAPFSRSGTPPAEPEIILSFPKLGQLKADRKRDGEAEVRGVARNPEISGHIEQHRAGQDQSRAHLKRGDHGIGA